MPRTMYDSVTNSAIPLNAQMVACYGDSKYMNVEEARTRFPNAVIVVISAAGTNVGTVGDCETGDLTPASSVDWVLMRRAAGADPTIYMSSSVWLAVRRAFQSRNVPEPHYWVAAYDGIPSIPAGAVAKQYASPGTGSGGNYDLSVVADYWPGVDTKEGLTMDQATALGLAQVAYCSIVKRPPTQDEEFSFAAALQQGGGFNTLCDQLQIDSHNPDVAPLQAPALLAAVQALQAAVVTLQAQVASLQQASTTAGTDAALRSYLRSGPQ